jgi:hypothetical protein
MIAPSSPTIRIVCPALPITAAGTPALQLRETRSRNRNRGCARAGMAVPIEMRQHEADHLASDSALIAARHGMIGHASEPVLSVEAVHLSTPPVRNR